MVLLICDNEVMRTFNTSNSILNLPVCTVVELTQLLEPMTEYRHSFQNSNTQMSVVNRENSSLFAAQVASN